MSICNCSQILRVTCQARRVATIKSKMNGAKHLLERHVSSIYQEWPSHTRNRRHFRTGWNLYAHFERDQPYAISYQPHVVYTSDCRVLSDKQQPDKQWSWQIWRLEEAPKKQITNIAYPQE